LLVTIVQYTLWALAVIAQITASVLLIKLKLAPQFPKFLCYTVFEVFRSVTLFAIISLRAHIHSAYAMYFDFYWITDAIWIALSLLVLYEVSRNFFRDYPLARKIASAVFTIGIVGLLLFDIYLTATAPAHENHHLITLILLIDRNLAVIETGLVVLLFICAQVMGLPLRTNLAFGVSLGLGILQSVNLVAVFARAKFGQTVNDLYAMSKMFAYALAVVVWLVYIFPPRPASNVCPELASVETGVEEWNDALTDTLSQ
jgi:hypothetical protein